MMPGRCAKLIVCLLAGVLAIALLSTSAYAAGVGQIKGKITDKETGEPLLGTSVMVVGTTFGAMTDFDGNYSIRQLEPGIYVLRITSLNYGSVEVSDVEVKTDLTTEQNQALSKQVTDLDVTITVIAVPDIINKFEISNQQTISREAIESKPVTSVEELLSGVAGVVTDQDGEIFIRGGRAGEVAYIVDGVPLGDPLGGLSGKAGAGLSLVSGSIQEFTVIKDGFDPEYGDALSGIVKITTSTGSKDNTRLNLQYMTDDLGNASLNKYSRNYDFVRFTLSGPDPILATKILPALGLNFLKDKEFTYFLYAQVSKDDGVHQYEDYDTPISKRDYGNFNLFGIDIPERLNNDYYWTGNLKFRPKPNLKFIFSYKSSLERYTVFSWLHRFTPNTAPVREDKWSSISLEVSQTVARNMNYEAVFSYSDNSVSFEPGDPNNPGHGLDPDDFLLNSEWEDYEDNNHNGVYDPPEPVINIYPDTALYGYDYAGPAYTGSELMYVEGLGWTYRYDANTQAGEAILSDFRFNDNGIMDNLEGEAFIDLNENGVWDAGDYLYDKNGNGIYDYNRENNIYRREAEPHINGDSIIGENFVDLNGNHVYDEGVDLFVMSTGPDNMDINDNGRYDGPNSSWSTGVPYVDRNGNGIYDDPLLNLSYDVGEYYWDLNGNGKWDDGGQFLNLGNYDDDALWHYHRTQTYRGELKGFWQLGQHTLKGGFAFQQDNYLYREIERPYYPYSGRFDGGPYETRGSFRDMWDYQPYRGTLYMRDKLEYGSMIASLGFRWDFFIQDRFALIEVAQEDDLGSGVILGDRHKFSPRIGFSYPISDKAKIHFNYGHFYQLPRREYMFQRNTVSVDRSAIIGNYNLDYQKTVQYSFGVKYAMSEYYSVDISGYFKDEFDKVNSQQVTIGGENSGVTYQQYQNSDYGRSRGFELQLDKRGGGNVNGSLSYTYAFAYGKASEAHQNYLNNEDLDRQPLSEAPLDDDIRHRIVANIQVFVQNTAKPRLFGLPIPNGWNLGLEALIEGGRPFTPDQEYPNLQEISGEDIQTNVLRKPATVVFNVRFGKDFEFVGMDYSFIVWVENLFDNRNVTTVSAKTGRPDTDRVVGGVVKGGTPYDLNPSNWDYGRQVRLGLELNL